MIKDNIFIKIEMKFIKVLGLMVRRMGMDLIFTNWEKSTKDTFKIIKKMEMVKYIMMMDQYLMVHLLKIWQMVTVS
jgi:hypothetical protein